jgi:hypothetical protein
MGFRWVVGPLRCDMWISNGVPRGFLFIIIDAVCFLLSLLRDRYGYCFVVVIIVLKTACHCCLCPTLLSLFGFCLVSTDVFPTIFNALSC